MYLTFKTSGISVQGEGRDEIVVNVDEVDIGSILDQIDAADIVDHYPVNDLLLHMSVEDFIAYHGHHDILDEIGEGEAREHFEIPQEPE